MPSEFANGGDINIHHLATAFIFNDPILRSLVAEANHTFMNLQREVKQVRHPDFAKVSRTYRSIVRACLQKLQDTLAKSDEHDDDDSIRLAYENYITIFYSVECVWHLCEILLIDATPSQIVVPQLLDWVRFHFPMYERKAAEMLFVDQTDSDEATAEFMPIVKGLIAQGQVEVARTLLRLHPDYGTASFQIAEEILKSMPTYSVSRDCVAHRSSMSFDSFGLGLRWIVAAKISFPVAILGVGHGI